MRIFHFGNRSVEKTWFCHLWCGRSTLRHRHNEHILGIDGFSPLDGQRLFGAAQHLSGAAIVDDVTHLSLAVDESFDIESPDTVPAAAVRSASGVAIRLKRNGIRFSIS